MEFETIVKGDKKNPIKVGKIASKNLYPFIGKKVIVYLKEKD